MYVSYEYIRKILPKNFMMAAKKIFETFLYKKIEYDFQFFKYRFIEMTH